MNNKEAKLRIIPLGGLEQIGMNITAFEYGDSIIVVDCGLSFPDDDMLGIDLVIPDVTYLNENIDKVEAFVITHGHEDHIGALPYVLRTVNVPIYATRLTMGLIERKLEEHDILESVERHVVNFEDKVKLGAFEVEFIKTNHSIVDAAALAIYSPAGTIVHTGDFKVDYTPVYGDSINLQRFAELGHQGVLALMCDSTNAERQGFTFSERTVGRTIDGIFQDNVDRRIIIATFASNVDRVQQIINSAYKYGRKVVLEGRSMGNIIETAQNLGCINIPDNTLIPIDQLKDYPPEKTAIITTGSQGESMAALSRMASDSHKKIVIDSNDVIVFSSHPIPGNEKPVTKTINALLSKGAEVIFQDAHVSGHACQEEIKLIYTLVQPLHAIPVHGEYKHLKAQANLLRELGYDKDRIHILRSGDVLEFNGTEANVVERIETKDVLVDGLGIGDVGNVVLRDRQILSANGIIVVAAAIDKGSREFVCMPEIVTRGFIYVKESDDIMEEMQDILVDTVDEIMEHNVVDITKMRSMIRDALSSYIWNKMERRPMIMPIIMEV